MSQLIDNLNIIESVKTDIKSAIEAKGVDMTGISFPGYASKIGEISGGGGVNPSGTLEISENGVYDVYSYASASVDVHPSASLSETYISNGNYNITGEFNGGVIKVDVPAPQFVTETLNVSANGVYNPGEGVDGYSKVVVDVPQSVIGYTQKNLTEGTIEITNIDNSASFVVNSAFTGNKTIKTVNLPYATRVGIYAFQDCNSLNQVSLPMCSHIGDYAFNGCNSLSQVSLPMCSYIGDNAFHYCSSLSQVSLPMCSHIGGNAFRNCSSLSQVSLPVCNYIADGIFAGGGLNNRGTFYDCSLLTQVDLPMCSYIGSDAFRGCNNLSIITIGYSSICSLKNTGVFAGTSITSSTGSIYVPASLVDAYKSAANWSYFSTQIFPIE